MGDSLSHLDDLLPSGVVFSVLFTESLFRTNVPMKSFCLGVSK